VKIQLGINVKFLLFQIVDTVKSFIDRVEDIGKTGYLPSQSVFFENLKAAICEMHFCRMFISKPPQITYLQDCLLARIRTSGIVEEQYEIDGATFCVFDVGGQRNERKKVCFGLFHAIISRLEFMYLSSVDPLF
jgi:hypothetical protein